MSTTENYYDQASVLLAQYYPYTTNHSEPYWEGYLDAVAWYLANDSKPAIRGSWYPLGTVQRDAWLYGWISGRQFVEKLNQASP